MFGSSLSVLYLALLLIVHIIYMLGIVCVPTLVLNQELSKHLNS